MYVNPSSILTGEAFNNPLVGYYADEPFEKSKQRTSNWKPIKQAIGSTNVGGETIWDVGFTTWDGRYTHWDGLNDHRDIMRKITPTTTFITQNKQGSTTFNKNKQGATSFTKIKER